MYKVFNVSFGAPNIPTAQFNFIATTPYDTCLCLQIATRYLARIIFNEKSLDTCLVTNMIRRLRWLLEERHSTNHIPTPLV